MGTRSWREAQGQGQGQRIGTPQKAARGERGSLVDWDEIDEMRANGRSMQKQSSTSKSPKFRKQSLVVGGSRGELGTPKEGTPKEARGVL